jgi:Ser/Thr protein kinase RdoA (MazF antagonist)
MIISAERIAREFFGIVACARRLPGEFDNNFHLVTAGGDEYLLKIMRAGCSPEFLDMQARAMEHLRDFPVPHPAGEIKTTNDKQFAWLLHWLPGRMMAEVDHTPAMLSNLGRLLGEIDGRLADFSHPFVHRELKWDLARAAWIADYLDYIPDARRREMVRGIVDSFGRAAPFKQIRRGVIHGDANTHNVLVDGDLITGLIDFGDLHYGAPAAELAVACAYAALGKSDPRGAIESVTSGYQEAFPLTEIEMSLLNLLISTRLAVSVTNSAYMKTISPDPYATVSEAQAWEALEILC